jgi:dTDP-4-dehydrorhamnose 3,5-epimerase
MKITQTGFEDLVVIEPLVYTDNRGYFFECYNQDSFQKAGISFLPVQDNESKSVKNVIRGLHYQMSPFEQAKLVRVIEGKIFDVALDIRRSSKTYGKWFGIELDSETKKQLFIPKGFAHGFSVLSDTAIVYYKCDNLYNPQYDKGISILDSSLGINWQVDLSEAVISKKDINNPHFQNAGNTF